MTVSIVIASYNGGHYIGAQLESLLQQNPPPDEVIITDDCSTDDTQAVVTMVATRYPNTRVQFERNPERLGVTGNFAHALSLITCDLVFYCDQDDFWRPGRLTKMVEALHKTPNATLVYADGLTADEHLNPTGTSILDVSPLPQLREYTPNEVTRVSAAIPGCIIGFPAAIVQYVLPFPTGWVHDHATAYIALALGAPVHADAPLMLYRRHSSNVSTDSWLIKRNIINQAKESHNASLTMYNNEHIRWQAMAERLKQIPDSAAHDPNRLQAFREVARHRADLAATRIELRQRGRIQRLSGLLKLYIRGDYRRYLRGWRTFARDLLIG